MSVCYQSPGFFHTSLIIESVDSISRDGPDVTYT